VAVLILVLRVALGGLFLLAGVLKAHDGVTATTASIAAYRILPPVAVAPLGLFLPYFEIGLGAYLLLGLFTRTAAVIAIAQLVVFAGAVASLVVRNIPADCGCLGSGVSVPPSWGHVATDLALAALALLVALRAPGALSVDAVLASRSALDEAREPTAAT
jgi:uncharacterized membrane protein YphA (DoxX/SURF4 family)